MDNRFERQERMFGSNGQASIAATRLVIVGVGGLGTHVVQQSALLGVGQISLIDNEELSLTNRNRYIGAYNDDPIPGSRKVDLAERLIGAIDPAIKVRKLAKSFISEEGFAEIIDADVVIGCLDTEGARLILNELCSAYERQYFDLASDIIVGPPLDFGGRVCAAWGGKGCLVCREELDLQEAQRDLAGEGERAARRLIYGVDESIIDQTGPSVVAINGVVASLAMTEFLAAVTGLREPRTLLIYHGAKGKVTSSVSEPTDNCYYCCGIRGRRETANLSRYLPSKIN